MRGTLSPRVPWQRARSGCSRSGRKDVETPHRPSPSRNESAAAPSGSAAGPFLPPCPPWGTAKPPSEAAPAAASPSCPSPDAFPACPAAASASRAAGTAFPSLPRCRQRASRRRPPLPGLWQGFPPPRGLAGPQFPDPGLWQGFCLTRALTGQCTPGPRFPVGKALRTPHPK